jgi:hypothetical protein
MDMELATAFKEYVSNATTMILELSDEIAELRGCLKEQGLLIKELTKGIHNDGDNEFTCSESAGHQESA